MGQTGYYDLHKRLDTISATGDPPKTIKTTVQWEDFRADIEGVTERKLWTLAVSGVLAASGPYLG
jgi:hypothetical protein